MLTALTVLAAGLLTVLAFQGWLIVHLGGQQARLHRRIDDVASRAAQARVASAAPLVAALAPPREMVAVPVAAARAPAFSLPSLAGVPTSLDDLLSRGKPVVLGFTDPRCGPCYELLPDIAGWQRVYAHELTVALVSGGLPEHNRAMTAEYGIDPRTILLQEERELAEAYDIAMAPAALVILPDGTVAGETVYGAQRVRQLVADTLGLAMPPAPGTEAHAQAAPAVRPAGLGERVPAVRRPDLDGNPVDLGVATGETTLVVFWSPGCGHCQDLLPDLRAWDANPAGPRLLVVTAGPVGLNREVGLLAPMVPDDDAALKRAFGVLGTPSAVVVDGLGIVASDVARGAAAVRGLVAARFAPLPAGRDDRVTDMRD